ncbi:MAG: cellulase family glycosylhydrolase [Microscillaceae bacterium]|nr:cellulase family glycosylhydrolase [Microscillaceae bacterium]
MMQLKLEGSYFKDELGRVLMLRGVNLGGSTKVPAHPKLPSHESNQFYSPKISFVDRPFPLKDADEHFSRLKSWGMNFLRFLVTWEAIEHEAPGMYDEKYLDYVYEVIKKAREYEIQVFIDPHQDVWSRFSGGDGAPLWTLEAVGLSVRQFGECEAAILHHQLRDQYPAMIWPTNYSKLACATMFTLFFGGNDFAPELKFRGEPIQEFLQNHYINAIKEVAKRLQGLDNVVGYDTLNEPSAGWIGCKNLKSNDFLFKMGASPSPFESMYMASGNPLQVEHWGFTTRGPKMIGKKEANPRGVRAWLNGHKCIWKTHGVWDIQSNGEPVLLKPNHFSEVHGKEVNFNRDYLLPFYEKYAAGIRSIDPKAVIFLEPILLSPPPDIAGSTLKNVVNASHWYDGLTLFTKKFRSWLSFDLEQGKLVIGRKKVRKLFASQLAKIKKESETHLNNAPTLIGETGIPFDMHQKKAYQNGNFSRQIKALHATLRALEDNLLSFTLWNYTADNRNEYGDMWNKEDLSVFSKDQQTDPKDINSGGRALEALLRPYPLKTSGIPIRLSFDMRKKVLEYEFEHEEGIFEFTEFYVPNFQYPKGYKVFVSDGVYEKDEQNQRLLYKHSAERYKHQIKIVQG